MPFTNPVQFSSIQFSCKFVEDYYKDLHAAYKPYSCPHATENLTFSSHLQTLFSSIQFSSVVNSSWTITTIGILHTGPTVVPTQQKI